MDGWLTICYGLLLHSYQFFYPHFFSDVFLYMWYSANYSRERPWIDCYRQCGIYIKYVFTFYFPFPRILNKVPAAKTPCQSRKELPVHLVYTDIVGLIQLKKRLKAGYAKFGWVGLLYWIQSQTCLVAIHLLIYICICEPVVRTLVGPYLY